VRAWALLLFLLCAAIALPATAFSQGKRAPSKFGLKAARVVKRPSLPPGADNDRDGLVNRIELDDSGTNPRKFDTDGDGFGDGAEVIAGSNPLDATSTPVGPPAPQVASPQSSAFEPPDEPPPDEPPPVDATPPNTTIGSGPSGTTSSTKATLGFSSNEAGSTFECALDASAWATCASPKTYNALALGPHLFSVRAKDIAGNIDPSPATQSWIVGTVPDTTPPNTSINSGPSSTTTSTGASFGFSSSESGSTFQCTLDSEPAVSCTSPASYSSLALGPHAFSVTATDGAGNTDPTPAKRSWTVAEPELPVDCTTSLSPGANVADAVESAAGGAVICLEAGSYGRISIDGAHKSPPVTVRSGSSGRATVNGISLTDPVGLRFIALDITSGTTVTPSGSNIQFIGNDITGVAGIYLFGDYRIDKLISDVLIEGNNIHDLEYSGNQDTGFGYGIEGVGEVRDMTIRDNTIKSPASDYIQSATPINWVVDHNTFLGPSLLGTHEDHQDLWQIFGGGENITFTNNVARDTETQESLLFQEGAFSNVDIENNLFDHDSRGYTCQIYQSTGLVFRNNTVVGSHWGCLFRDLPASPPGSGYEVDHNVFAETEASVDVSEEGRAGDWGTYDYNVSSDNSAEGVHSVRNWSPSWMDTTGYGPLGLPFAAGYAP
jgi:hypothetical protein